MGGICQPNSNFTEMTFHSHKPSTYVVPTMKAMVPRIFPRHSRSRRARPMQLSRGRGETTTRKNEQFVSATKRGETAWIRSSRSLFPSAEGEIFRIFPSSSACFVRKPRGARTMAPVCQEASGSRQPFVKGITSSPVSSPPRNIKIPTYLRRAWRRAPRRRPGFLACFACTFFSLRSTLSRFSFIIRVLRPFYSYGPVRGTQ